MIKTQIEVAFNKQPEFKHSTLLSITDLKKGIGTWVMEIDWEQDDGMSYAADAEYDPISKTLEVG